MERFVTRLSTTHAEAVMRLAKVSGVSEAEVIRKAVAAYLEKLPALPVSNPAVATPPAEQPTRPAARASRSPWRTQRASVAPQHALRGRE